MGREKVPEVRCSANFHSRKVDISFPKCLSRSLLPISVCLGFQVYWESRWLQGGVRGCTKHPQTPPPHQPRLFLGNCRRQQHGQDLHRDELCGA
jgi:hypothetical protein